MTPCFSTEDAIRYMRGSADYRELVDEAYLDEDGQAATERFGRSVEFRETLQLLDGSVEGKRVLDLGAGTGLATQAFARAGAAFVLALEPDCSDVVGLGKLRAAPGDLAIGSVASWAEAMPLADESVDVVYCRQVLHHLHRLPEALVECARVLRPGGIFVATREHVVDDDAQLATFLAEHPVHQLAGGEHAWSLDAYLAAIRGAGLELTSELGPWDAVINAFPAVSDADELRRGPAVVLSHRFGPVVGRLGGLPGVRDLLWSRLRRPKPGRLYTFVAVKPAGRDGSTDG